MKSCLSWMSTTSSVLCWRTSCAYDAEQRVYTLTLRSGVTFSDGSALTARDVAATLEQARQSQRYAARLAEVSSVRAQGDTVRITMSADLATLAWRLDIPIVKAGTECGYRAGGYRPLRVRRIG